MRYKTNKLINLEKKRYSILTNDLGTCYLCRNDKDDIHEIYGGRNRVVSIKNGFCVPLCRLHHRVVTDNPSMNLKLQKLCQKVFEFNHTRKEFMQLIGKSYLGGENDTSI